MTSPKLISSFNFIFYNNKKNPLYHLDLKCKELFLEHQLNKKYKYSVPAVLKKSTKKTNENNPYGVQSL